MPIAVTRFDHRKLCHGYVWRITDEQLLANLAAQLILGHYRHVARVLNLSQNAPPISSAEQIDKAQAQMRAPASEPARWHRDGWVFQMISWVALRMSEGDSVMTGIPQPRSSDKGFDGLFVRVDPESQSFRGVVISEDKATTQSRSTIRDKVWPEFAECEKGQRDSELVAEITAILERHNVQDLDSLIQHIHWEEQREYRVSITVTNTHGTPAGRRALFAGYDSIVTGGKERRRGETLKLDDLRGWMDQFCIRIVQELEGARTQDV